MYLLDTNAVIDFLNAKLPDEAKELLQNTEPIISVITRIELFGSAKISDIERLKLEKFVQIATIYDTISLAIIDCTIQIRQKYGTRLPDAIIASTALSYDLTLVSRNISDFKNIKGLKLIDPHSL
jgi:predicted nucleic acid-binding protein